MIHAEKLILKDKALSDYCKIEREAQVDLENMKDMALKAYNKIQQPAYSAYLKKLEEIGAIE